MPVYFIQAGKRGPVKIGHSRNPRTRLYTLDIFHYAECRIIREVPGAKRTEKWLHERFAHKHIRREWFGFDCEMLTVQPPVIEEPFIRNRCEQMLRAIRHADGGNVLAHKLGITRQAIYAWDRVPAQYVLAVEKACQGFVTRHDLRPDLYPPPLKVAA